MNNTKKLILTIIILTIANSSESKYIPTPLIELVGKAELIVYGTIKKVGKEQFKFNIHETLYGEDYIFPKGEIIEVIKFKNWTCASRWTEYKNDQELVLFLYQNGEGKNITWRILGGGDEGENFIQYGMVLFDSRGIPMTNSDSLEEDLKYKFKKIDFFNAIKDYREVFSVNTVTSPDGYRSSKSIGLIVDNKGLKKYKSISPAHKYLAEESIKKIENLREAVQFE